MHKLKFKLNRNAFPIYGAIYTTCIGGCDSSFNEVLNIRNESIRNISQGNDTGYSSTFDELRSNNSNPPSVRNIGTQPPRVGNRTNLSENNTSIGLVRSQNTTRNNSNRSRNNANARKRTTSENDTWIDTNTFRSSNNDFRSPRSEQSKTWGDIDNDAVIMCRCHENAIQLTVRKEGPNQGINYTVQVDLLKNVSRFNTRFKIHISGRLFYKCAKPQGTGCDFFLWASDDPQQMQNSTNRGPNQRQAPNTSVQSSAYPSTSSTWGNSNTFTSPDSIMCRCNEPAKE